MNEAARQMRDSDDAAGVVGAGTQDASLPEEHGGPKERSDVSRLSFTPAAACHTYSDRSL